VTGHSGAFTALVLAGRRGPSDAFADALANADGADHHALIDVAGTPMLLRVIRVLESSPNIAKVVISIDDPAALDRVPELASRVADGRVQCRVAANSPSRSVAAVLADTRADEPVLVVAGDHALLTREMVEYVTGAEPDGADVLVAVVTAEVIRARYPESTRTYLNFRDHQVSGANLFAFLTPEAGRVADFWVNAEQFRKRPWRLVSVFGPAALFAFLFRRLDLDAAFDRVSDSVRARVRALRLPWAEAAIDVDRPADLELVNRIIAARERSGTESEAQRR
jgi:2-C-methyl-D-erythritol 4-phosphate cytidylyltransferase